MRNISANIFADEFFGTLNKVNRLLWIGLLLNIADDQGRMMDNVALMRSLLFPYDADVTVKDIEKGLALFAAKHKITRYAVGTNGTGKQLIQIVNWWKYQVSARWAKKSLYPAPEKWIDRVRVHDVGRIITTFNWENPGGYQATVKRLNSRYIATVKPHDRQEEEEEEEDSLKDSSLLSVGIKNLFSQKVEKLDANAENKLIALAVPDKWISDAVDIAVSKNKRHAKYVIGILQNWKQEGRNNDHKLSSHKTTTTTRTHRQANVPAGSQRNASTEKAAALVNKLRSERKQKTA